METFQNRSLEVAVVQGVIIHERGIVQLDCGTFGFNFTPDKGKPIPVVGDEIVVETKGMSMVTGVCLNDDWIMHKSDADLEADRLKFIEDNRQRNIAMLRKNEASWREREEALPDWIKPRLRNFHERGGFNFRVEGWGYELIIAELAVLYRESGGEDSPTIMEYANLHGTSGNQHEVAKVLATFDEERMDQTVAGLTPLGAHPFYEETT